MKRRLIRGNDDENGTRGDGVVLRVSLDTAPVLDWLDWRVDGRLTDTAQHIDQILAWHSAGRIQAFISNRVFDPDTQRMPTDKVEALKRLLNEHGVDIAPAAFRLDISCLDGGDVLNGPPTRLTLEEMNRFDTMVGPDPTSRPDQKSAANRIADWDHLRDHFAAQRDIFITTDRGEYFAKHKRAMYERELGLVIRTPHEFVAEFAGAH